MAGFERKTVHRRLCFFVMSLCFLAAGSCYVQATEMRDLIGQLDVYSTTAEQAIEILGEPLDYLWGGRTLTKDNLPSVYIMKYPENVSVVVKDRKVYELRFESGPDWYVFGENLRIGSSLEDVFEELGQPRAIVDDQPNGPLDLTLYRDLSKGKYYYRCSDRDVRLFLWNNRVSSIYVWQGRGHSAYASRRVSEYADVRKLDLSRMDLTKNASLVSTLTFNGRTVWPDEKRLPEGFDPRAWIEAGMDPGLSIRKLNAQGMTGEGVSVGVIGYGLNTAHPEFAERIAWYVNLMAVPHFRQEGAAVAGLLAGANCGVAPGAEVYYCAVKTNASEGDYVEALARLIEKNKTLAAGKKIKIVCVAAAPGEGRQKSKAGQDTWGDVCIAAEQAGMLIIDGTHRHGIIRQCTYDPGAPDDVSACIPGAPDTTPIASPKNIYVPTSPRTVPEHAGSDGFDYAYHSRGESSWSIPYCVGVLALGWQSNPQLTGEEIVDILYRTAYVTPEGARIIYPLMFVTEVIKTASR